MHGKVTEVLSQSISKLGQWKTIDIDKNVKLSHLSDQTISFSAIADV